MVRKHPFSTLPSARLLCTLAVLAACSTAFAVSWIFSSGLVNFRIRSFATSIDRGARSSQSAAGPERK